MPDVRAGLRSRFIAWNGAQRSGARWRGATYSCRMPLPAARSRRQIHTRRIELRAYLRDDGLYDLEAHLTDRKPHDFTVTVGPLVPAGMPIHEMWVRLTIDDQLLVRDIAGATDATPYADCRSAPPTLRSMIGARIGSGWSREVKLRLGDAKSCTHLRDLLAPLGTLAVQALVDVLRVRPLTVHADGRPSSIDSCYALASHRSVVALRWPEHATRSPDREETD